MQAFIIGKESISEFFLILVQHFNYSNQFRKWVGYRCGHVRSMEISDPKLDKGKILLLLLLVK